MGHPLPDDEIERSALSRHGGVPQPDDLARPEWLTRAGDGAEHGSPSGPPRVNPTRPGPPTLRRPTAAPAGRAGAPGLSGPPDHAGAPGHGGAPGRAMAPGVPGHDAEPLYSSAEVPRLETDSALSGYQPGHGSAPFPDSDSWEGTVHRVAREADGSGAATIRFHRRPSAGAFLAGLMGSRTLLIVAVVAAAVVAVMTFRPKAEETTSISAIRRHPERFEGRAVKVKGRVGEVFEVGGGYAFHLHQGRENIVVFTRSRVPVRREELTISGSVSNGILDGKPRQALFETPR